jgi:hypothetical protein
VPCPRESKSPATRFLGMAGAGGMGVVYGALDIKLQRTVALKFAPADLNASEKDKERFLKEARAASSPVYFCACPSTSSPCDPMSPVDRGGYTIKVGNPWEGKDEKKRAK